MAEGRLKKIWNVIVGAPESGVATRSPRALSGTYRTIHTTHYDGEKNLGGIGPIKNYWLDYEALRLRSWQSYLESEIAQTVIKKYAMWVIGSGLKLQAEPSKKVLQYEGINIDSEEFNEAAEALFTSYAKSSECDYSGMRNLHIIAKETFLNAIIGGDILVILRYIDGNVKVQTIDGCHVCSPMYGNDYYGQATGNGNTIRHGIELSPSGQHVAYYVYTDKMQYERIPARTADGMVTTFLVCGLKYRLDNHRGIPIIATVLETLKKLERYKEATVGSAEERQKIAYSIEHDIFSTGENPLAKNLAKAFNADAVDEDIPIDVQGKQLADTVAATTEKMAFNMPIGSHLKALESKNELYFKDFYNVNIDLVCASLGIPPEVAMSKYDSNFSASRAALKDWEHTINVARAEFSFDFYQKVYNFWLDIQILKNKIRAVGYLIARLNANTTVIIAYRTARFVGATVPHIDPLKEVNAERAKLGGAAANIPLTTVEAATEALNGGDSDQNMMQYAEELEMARELGIPEEQKEPESEPAQESD